MITAHAYWCPPNHYYKEAEAVSENLKDQISFPRGEICNEWWVAIDFVHFLGIALFFEHTVYPFPCNGTSQEGWEL